MRHDVIIVGAGAAGVGMAAVLKDFGIEDYKLLDRQEVGASFARWPAEMRLITPSFNTTPFGILDLNAVALNTSVANFLGVEHPTGKQYARYLEAVVDTLDIPVQPDWEITDVEILDNGDFRLSGPRGSLDCGSLIWAAGEFQFPHLTRFPGAEQCVHNSMVPSFRHLEGEDFMVIGAFESGVDAAVHLAENGKSVTLLCAEEALPISDQDPSRSLSPFTRERLRSALARKLKIKICYNYLVTRVDRIGEGWSVSPEEGPELFSSTTPILATGFRGGLGPVRLMFGYRKDGNVELSEDDESTVAPGLFLSGPMVRHGNHILCYIYKFRQRFAVIAETIAERLEIPVSEEILETYERNQMRLLDFSCCGETCAS